MEPLFSHTCTSMNTPKRRKDAESWRRAGVDRLRHCPAFQFDEPHDFVALRYKRGDKGGEDRAVSENPPPEFAAIHGKEGWRYRLIGGAILRPMAPMTR